MTDIIRVAGKSRSAAVAGAIAGVVRNRGHAEAQAIGARAVNQAIKAVAIARSYLNDDGVEVVCMPGLTTVQINGQERTAVSLVVECR